VGLAKHLTEAGIRVVVYDPAAMENARRVLPFHTVFAASPVECAGQADVLAITTPWQEFRALTTGDLLAVIDFH
jgi:UDPglucose 6-dehydrogenase